MALKKCLKIQYMVLLMLNAFVLSMGKVNLTSIDWVLTEANYTRLCSTKSILTVNGMFPGPPLYMNRGDRLIVNIHNHGKYNVTIHWHGVLQPRNPWSDGPEYITQCPIQPGASFSYEILLSREEGTLWWHAHSDWSRATVHGPIFVYPKPGSNYPFPKPHAEFPVILGSWFRGDVMQILESALANGGEFNRSDSLTINGQPGHPNPCSRRTTSRFTVAHGQTYLLRIINAIMNEEVFFAVARHRLTVVGMDGAYVKPINTNYIMITPGQTMDVLITANQRPSHYYMAARAYAGVVYDNTTTTAVLQYTGNYTTPPNPIFPILPNFTDIAAVTNFTNRLRSLASKEHPVDVPQTVDTRMLITVSLNTLPCPNTNNVSCVGPSGNRLAASLNNISFSVPEIDVLLAYFRRIRGVYGTQFPSNPPEFFNFTEIPMPSRYRMASNGTEVKVLEYGTNVEIVFQGTNVLNSAENHPMHLHGYSFYVVGSGFGNFNNVTDPRNYNLVDPPELNTFGIPTNGWAAVRFRADNPGVWFMHCHLERHATWGMETAFIVKNGGTRLTNMRRPPRHLNPC